MVSDNSKSLGFFLRETVAGLPSWILGLLAIFLGGFPNKQCFWDSKHQGSQDSEQQATSRDSAQIRTSKVFGIQNSNDCHN